ncbi:predicted protein [Histoplasma capsulatum var. duboisii H88]|uniref:Predicted protein n=1 Tax=Ajellomyces capsulatus (strain H88) TaxID=544711 RepID=F0UJK4_AJEC8|nr:predicted protein [Histoplasma capsulatum var. duboisii H88]
MGEQSDAGDAAGAGETARGGRCAELCRTGVVVGEGELTRTAVVVDADSKKAVGGREIGRYNSNRWEGDGREMERKRGIRGGDQNIFSHGASEGREKETAGRIRVIRNK